MAQTVTIMKAKVSALDVDPAVQRQLDVARVHTMAREFDPTAVGVVTVSKRKNGTMVTIDGQHRRAAAQEAKGPDYEIDARVLTGLSLQEEAHLFRLLNNTVKPKPFDGFLVRLVEQEPVATAIHQIVTKYGWEIKAGKAPATVSCVSAMETVYRSDPDDEHSTLDRVFQIVTSAWGDDVDGGNASVIRGLGNFIWMYGDHVDYKSLADGLKKAGPAAMWLGKAQLQKSAGGGNLHAAMTEVVRRNYNVGRRKGILA